MAEGIGPDCQDKGGSTPLLYAAYYGRLDVLVELLQASAKVNFQGHRGLKTPNSQTALFPAAANGHAQIVATLLRYRADPRIRDDRDQTALRVARLHGRESTGRWLRKAFARYSWEDLTRRKLAVIRGIEPLPADAD